MNNIELRWAKSRSAPFIDATKKLQYRQFRHCPSPEEISIGVNMFGSWTEWIDVPEVYISDKDEA